MVMDVPTVDFMHQVFAQLSTLTHQADDLDSHQAAESSDQLVELQDELLQKHKAKKIYPDHKFKREHDQQDYNTLKDVAHLLSNIEVDVLPPKQQGDLTVSARPRRRARAKPFFGQANTGHQLDHCQKAPPQSLSPCPALRPVSQEAKERTCPPSPASHVGRPATT